MKIAALLALTCAACANVDNAGYVLPNVSLVGTTCIVSVIDDERMQGIAQILGLAQKRGEKLNAYYQKINEACVITVTETALYKHAPLIAHEFHHAKGWRHD